MSLSVKEKISKIWTKDNLFLVSKILGTFVGLCGTLWIVAQIYLDDYVDNKIQQHETEVRQRQESEKSLQELLSVAMDVPIEMVPYEIAFKLNDLDSLLVDVNRFSDVILPYIDHQMSWTIPRMEIEPITGDEYWIGRDGRPYQIIYSSEVGRIWYHGSWVEIWK